jgi:hypothetical protein
VTGSVAYGFTGEPGRIWAVDEYVGNKGQKAPKAPTVIKYDPSNRTKFQWGYELDRTVADKIVGVKLLLDPDQPKVSHINGLELRRP